MKSGLLLFNLVIFVVAIFAAPAALRHTYEYTDAKLDELERMGLLDRQALEAHAGHRDPQPLANRRYHAINWMTSFAGIRNLIVLPCILALLVNVMGLTLMVLRDRRLRPQRPRLDETRPTSAR